MQTTTARTRNPAVAVIVALAFVAAIAAVFVAVSFTSDGSSSGQVDRLVTEADMGRYEATELVESFEALGMSDSEVDQAVTETIELTNQIAEMETDPYANEGTVGSDGYDANGFDENGCNEGETFNPDTGWCEL